MEAVSVIGVVVAVLGVSLLWCVSVLVRAGDGSVGCFVVGKGEMDRVVAGGGAKGRGRK